MERILTKNEIKKEIERIKKEIGWGGLREGAGRKVKGRAYSNK